MLLKKSSTLTAEAEDLAEISAPMKTVVVDGAEAGVTETDTGSLRFIVACTAFLARSSCFRCRSIAVKVDSLRARTEAETELSTDAVADARGAVVDAVSTSN